MKIAYLTCYDFSKENSITKKIRSQCKSWRTLGCEVRVFSVASSSYTEDDIEQFSLRMHYLNWYKKHMPKLVNSIRIYQPDIIYLRFEPYKGFFEKLKDYPIVLEINSDELAEYYINVRTAVIDLFAFQRKSLARLFKSMYIYVYSNITRSVFGKLVSGVFYPTRELQNRDRIGIGKPYEIIPNSIDFQEFEVIPKINTKKKHLIFLGAGDKRMRPWHGVDIMERLSERLPEEFVIDVVGQTGKDTEKIVYLGYLQYDEYKEYLQKAIAGIGTLALFRENMEEACSLKVREYIAHGLPLILGYSDSAFMQGNPEWVFRVPNNSSWVSDDKIITELVLFLGKVEGVRVPHSYSETFFDSKILEKRRVDFFKKMVSNFYG